MVHRTFFVAEIQRRIVLKFQIFRILSFEDIIVGSWSGLTFGTQVTGPYILAAKLDFFENCS